MDTELSHIEKPPQFVVREGGKSTYFEEENIPDLPMPDLNHTLDMYVDSVVMHLKPSEYSKTLKNVEEFRRDLGPKLQKKLIERSRNKRNWLEDLWLEFAYLRSRVPLLPLSNMNGPSPYFSHYWPPKMGTQVFRTAVTVYNLSTYRQMIRNGTLAIDRKASGQPWSMSQYPWIFNTCRNPGKECDYLVHHMKLRSEERLDRNAHIVVISNGLFFKLELYDREKEALISIPEIHLQLKRIKEMSQHARRSKLPLLTALERTKWFEVREKFLSLDPRNVSNLNVIETAAMCVTFDDHCPTTPDEIITDCIRHGDGMVWADKSYSIMTFETGILCVTADHSPVDGGTLLATSYYNDFEVYNNKGYPGLEAVLPSNADSMEYPEELVFVTDNFIQEQIECGLAEFQNARATLEATLQRFPAWKRRTVRQKGFVPDTLVQLSLQLAYFRMHKKLAPTYETASTRLFWHGRTETIRSCTPESVNWCMTMAEPSCSTDERCRLFKIAHDKHNKWRDTCESGHGCDRHLLGLMCMAGFEGIPTPAIFTDPAWVKSGGNGNFVLSTSTLGYSSVIGCVAAMVNDGYGVFYRMGRDLTEMVITNYNTSNETDCHKFAAAVDEAMKEISSLLDLQVKSKL